MLAKSHMLHIKRFIDLSLILIALPILLPITVVTAICVRKRFGSPVLFVQTRPGKNGRLFKMFKFRTMRDTYGEGGHLLSDADRLTTFGIKLRASSLDELPALWNVIRGDMSLVGPRPLLVEYLPLYSSHQSRRHEIKPGITGWAQVNGRNSVNWTKRFELDVWYVDNLSFKLDLQILLMTMVKAVKREGITAKGEATMTKFTGNKSAG